MWVVIFVVAAMASASALDASHRHAVNRERKLQEQIHKLKKTQLHKKNRLNGTEIINLSDHVGDKG